MITIRESAQNNISQPIDKTFCPFIEDIDVKINYEALANVISDRLNNYVNRLGCNAAININAQNDYIDICISADNDYTYPINLVVYCIYTNYDGLIIVCENRKSHYAERFTKVGSELISSIATYCVRLNNK